MHAAPAKNDGAAEKHAARHANTPDWMEDETGNPANQGCVLGCKPRKLQDAQEADAAGNMQDELQEIHPAIHGEKNYLWIVHKWQEGDLCSMVDFRKEKCIMKPSRENNSCKNAACISKWRKSLC